MKKIMNKKYKSLTSPPKPRSPELGDAEVFVLELEAAAVPDVLAPELHWQ